VIDVLADLECSDRDVQWDLETLRRELIRHVRNGDPWRVGEALDALLPLDAPAWAVLRGLISECPTLHDALSASGRARLRIDPSLFRFVASRRDIAIARDYLSALTSVLAGSV
jgi:hypothetical protein